MVAAGYTASGYTSVYCFHPSFPPSSRIPPKSTQGRRFVPEADRLGGREPNPRMPAPRLTRDLCPASSAAGVRGRRHGDGTGRQRGDCERHVPSVGQPGAVPVRLGTQRVR